MNKIAVDLNNSPDLTMEDITKQLFNNKFMSDVQFRVDGNILYAHSWELMKRSIVFRAQLKGIWADSTELPIADTSYKAFYEFLRFIYTDEFDTEESLRCDILKLAVKYKIVKLENTLVNMVCNLEVDLQYLQYSVVDKYELIHNFWLEYLIEKLDVVVNMGSFLDIHPDVVEEILKSNQIPPEMTEAKLFNALVLWMNRSCKINQIPLSERRTRFDKFLRLVRFPTMTTDEFRFCFVNHNDLFSTEDISIICHKITLGSQYKNEKWMATPRLEYVDPVERIMCGNENFLATNFTVSKDLVLCGLRHASANCEILIYAKHRKNGAIDFYSFDFIESGRFMHMNPYNLGESIKLKPNVDYAIDIKYTKNSRIYRRKPTIDCIITGPPDVVTFTVMGENIFEIFFKLPTK